MYLYCAYDTVLRYNKRYEIHSFIVYLKICIYIHAAVRYFDKKRNIMTIYSYTFFPCCHTCTVIVRYVLLRDAYITDIEVIIKRIGRTTAYIDAIIAYMLPTTI